MSEGGFLPWKRQHEKQFATAADYRGLKNPLPHPPAGKRWHQDEETREWSLKSDSEHERKDEEEKVLHCIPDIVNEDSKTNEGADECGDEWSLLSDKISTGSIGGTGVFVNRAGSICSITSFSSNHSSSTVSCSVDYVEHVVLPSDTLQGICLAYKVNATRIRQANHFSGNSLLLAPKTLIIPITKRAQRSGKMFIQSKDTHEYKMSAFRAECPDYSLSESKAYLELSDWDLHEAIRSAREDSEWEKQETFDNDPAGATDIKITVKCDERGAMGFTTIGAGIQPRAAPKPPSAANQVIYEGVPAIATKTVTPQDVYNAAPQHDNFGVELQPLVKSSSAGDEES